MHISHTFEVVAEVSSLLAMSGVMAILAVTTCIGAESPDTSTPSPEQSCMAISSAKFLDVQDAPTQITETFSVKASDGTPGYCRVTGYVAPQVGIKLALPESWNGKLIEMGCGGHCGYIGDDFLATNCAEAVRKGYACIISNAGHTGASWQGDTAWAYNNLQGMVDWGYRGAHVAAVAGKAVTQAFYKKPPAHSYFCGCSTGGRQALQEAQRFPWDFDGIIAGAPPIRLADLYVTFAWGQLATHDAADKPLLSVSDLKLLTDGALALCDLDDGVRDGIISSPFKCPFRPSDLACEPGQSSACLTPEKVKAAEKVYSGPVDSQGNSLFEAGALPGSELGGEWEKESGASNWGFYYLGNNGAPPSIAPLAQQGLKLLFSSPPLPLDWTIRSFDFSKDYKRLDVMQSLYDSSNPDLTRFKQAGGKLLIYHGLNDLSILPAWIIRYYEKVERVMGGREQTQSFVRLFSLPGVEHCAGGPGADTVDYLSYLEDWVERGRTPDKIIGAHVDFAGFMKNNDLKGNVNALLAAWEKYKSDPKNILFTRPIYPYPMRAKYRGRGDPNDAANFVAQRP